MATAVTQIPEPQPSLVVLTMSLEEARAVFNVLNGVGEMAVGDLRADNPAQYAVGEALGEVLNP